LRHFSTVIMVMTVLTSTWSRFPNQRLRCPIIMVESIKKQAFTRIGMTFPTIVIGKRLNLQATGISPLPKRLIFHQLPPVAFPRFSLSTGLSSVPTRKTAQPASL
jgi:hypothetical protein